MAVEEVVRRSGTDDRALMNFDHLPNSACVSGRVVEGVTGWHRATIWRKIKAGKFPAPIRFGPQSNRWQVGAIRAAIASLAETA